MPSRTTAISSGLSNCRRNAPVETGVVKRAQRGALLEQHHAQPGAASKERRRRADDAAADDDHVRARRQLAVASRSAGQARHRVGRPATVAPARLRRRPARAAAWRSPARAAASPARGTERPRRAGCSAPHPASTSTTSSCSALLPPHLPAPGHAEPHLLDGAVPYARGSPGRPAACSGPCCRRAPGPAGGSPIRPAPAGRSSCPMRRVCHIYCVDCGSFRAPKTAPNARLCRSRSARHERANDRTSIAALSGAFYGPASTTPKYARSCHYLAKECIRCVSRISRDWSRC